MGEVTDNVRSSSKKGTIWGVIVLVLGIVSIAMPFVAGVALTSTIGIILMITGVAQFLYAFQSDSFGAGVLRFVFGLLALACGVALVANPGAGLATITLFLAVWFVVDGVWAVIHGFGLKPAPGWGWMVFSGVISVVLGVMVYRQFPTSAVWLVGVLVGIRLMFAGMTMIAMGSAGKAVANQVDEVSGQS